MRSPRPAFPVPLIQGRQPLGCKGLEDARGNIPPRFSHSGAPPPHKGDKGFLIEAHAVGSALPELQRVCIYFDL